MSNIYLVSVLSVFIIAGIMEIVKKIFNRNGIFSKSEKAAYTVIACFICLIVAIVDYEAFDVFREGTSSLAIIVYAVVFYFIQKDVSMEVIKPFIKKLANRA